MTAWMIFAISMILTATPALAQGVIGNWRGTLPRNGRSSPQVVVHLSKGRNGELNGAMYEGPGIRATPFTSISLRGSTLTFTLTSPSDPISFVGTVSDDGNSIDGWLRDQHLKLEREDALKGPAQKAVTPASASVETTHSAAMVPATESEILSRALAKLAGTSQRLLKYSCTETVERAYYTEPPLKKLGPHAMSQAPVESCDGREFSKDGHLSLDAEDRLRLAVAVASGTEIQSWAAASRFDSRSVFELIPEGPITTGASGSVLVDIFENPGAKYSFIGRKRQGFLDIFEYAFEVPLAASYSHVRAGTKWITTAYRGSFEIDAASAELVRLTSETDPLPSETKMCRFRTDTNYRYIPIGNGQFLMPGRSTFDTLSPNGNETRSVTTFSACHEYAAESSVVFNQEVPAVDAKVAPRAGAPLPPGLSLTVALLEPMDLGTAAAGDAVAGKVTKAVRAPGSNEILVDAGSILHGRITQMQHRYSTSQFAFAIRYETLEQRDSVSPVAIELDRELKAEQARTKNGFARRGSEFSLHAPAASDDAGSWFAFSAASGGYVVAAGFESKWVTVAK